MILTPEQRGIWEHYVMYDELKHLFTHHPVKDEEQAQKYEALRAKCLDLAIYIRENTPGCREQMRAIERLEEVMMWSNASVARHT